MTTSTKTHAVSACHWPRADGGRARTHFQLRVLEAAKGRSHVSTGRWLRPGRARLTCTTCPLHGTTSCARRLVGVSNRRTRAHRAYTYRFEYTPGMRASSRARGRGASHRSGRHVNASSPHKAGFVLHAHRLRTAILPLGTAIDEMSVPSRPRTGVWRGRTVSCAALEYGVAG